jgi:hypothetical protein
MALTIQGGSAVSPGPDAQLRDALGWKAWTFPPHQIISTANAMTSQRAFYQAVYLNAGTVLTNLHCYLTNTPTSLTLAKMGLYQGVGQTVGAPVRVAVTADDSANWTGAGLRTIAISGGAYTVPTSGIYYFASLAVCTGTLPQIMGGSAQTNIDLVKPSGKMAYNSAQNSQADLPATATFSAGTNFIMQWYAAT